MQLLNGDPEIISLGRMEVVYVPATKMEQYAEVQAQFDRTLIETYQGMTKMTQFIEGHYQMGPNIVRDPHVRYEVSFSGGENRVMAFLALIKQLCRDLGEKSIYLTMGDKSFLVQPKQKGD